MAHDSIIPAGAPVDRFADPAFRPNLADAVREASLMLRACRAIPRDNFPFTERVVELMLDAMSFSVAFRASGSGGVSDHEAQRLLLCALVGGAVEIAFPESPSVILYGSVVHAFEGPGGEPREARTKEMVPVLTSVGLADRCGCDVPVIIDPWGMMWRDQVPGCEIPIVMVGLLNYGPAYLGSVYTVDSVQTSLWCRRAEADRVWHYAAEFKRRRGPAYAEWLRQEENA